MALSPEILRLRKVISWLIYEDYAKNETNLAETLGYNKSSFSQVVNGKVPLSDRFLNKLYIFNTNINKNWIRTGEGTMLESDESSINIQGGNIIIADEAKDNQVGKKNIKYGLFGSKQKMEELMAKINILEQENELLKKTVQQQEKMIQRYEKLLDLD